MGHSQGKISINKRQKNETDTLDKTFDPNRPAPELTEREMELLREMWNILNKDIAKVGVVTFIDLFDTHPEVKDVFMAFRTEETSKLEYDHVLRAHALRVMGTVEKCINRLDNPEKFQSLLMELGTRHQGYSVKIPYVDLMGPQFIASIKPHLESVWTKEAEQAWENMFKLICYHMKKGICSV